LPTWSECSEPKWAPRMTDSYLVFGLRESRYAISVALVREIVWLPELAQVDELPPDVAGVFDLRGSVVPVIDLLARFGRARAPLRTTDQVIVLGTAAARVGVIANELHDVANIPATSIADASNYHGAGGQARFVRGEARLPDGLAMVLDVEALLAGSRSDVGVAPHEPMPADDAAVLRRRALVLAERPVESEHIGRRSYAIIRLGRELYGVGLDVVREFVHLRGVVPVPCCPPHVVGNMNLRGDVLTVVDIRAVLGLDRKGETPKVAVLAAGELKVGIPATEIVDVLHVAPSELKPRPPSASSAGEQYCTGIALLDGQAVTLLDIHRVLATEALWVEEFVQ
jgi:purine-binding chemotaxis protein CheW